MKITKLKHGYVIRLSDVEMNVLETLVNEGELGQVCDSDMSGWKPSEKAAYTRRINAVNQFLHTDENRR